MCNSPYRCMEHETECEVCGTIPANNPVQGYDRCPTDRGDETRYYTAYVCDKCAERYER